MPKPKEEIVGRQIRPKPYKPHMGKCVIECPVGYGEKPLLTLEQSSKKEQLYTCEKCEGKSFNK